MRTSIFHGLRLEKDVHIPLRDGAYVVADVFRPDGAGRFPAVMTMGPYSKDIHFRDWNPLFEYERLPERGPYMHWETVNPEWWVPQGYVVIRVDGRGTGKSPGRVRRLSDAEACDFYDAIEWSAAEPWSNGRVAVMGISYFAMNAWRVAAQQPPHLAAIVPWEGAVDTYRDAGRHGGIYSNGFNERWSRNLRSHERGAAADLSPARAELPVPPELFTDTAYHCPDLGRIRVPLLSAGNWGGVGLHLRGNVEGFLGAGSDEKFLEIHSGDHIVPFYSLDGRTLQKRFLDQWLLDADTGILREPRVRLAIRRSADRYVWRYEDEWPIARTEWTAFHLDADKKILSRDPAPQPGETHVQAEPAAPPAAARALFMGPTFERETEFTGPVALRLWISSTVDDADLFAVIRKIGRNGSEITFPGAISPGIPAAYGWLRASHRKLDPTRSTPYRPYHTHDELLKLDPGAVVPLEIEIWPTSIVFEPGDRLVLEVAAEDDPRMAPFLHDHALDRVRRGTFTLYSGGAHDSQLLMPLIPQR
ncbi:MAG TPA: CocE/NonD family hydrolase [Myxococcota bacterium]|nr:CocE/NonD family hydrolase [Myxococcota bacterium]